MSYSSTKRLLIIALVCLLAPLGSEAQNPSTTELEKSILHQMESGRPADEDIDRWLELRGTDPRRPARTKSNEAEELRRTLENFGRLNRASADRDASRATIARILPAYDALRAADLLFRERFDTVAAKLSQAEISPEIQARLEEARERYEVQRAIFLAPLEEPMERIREASLSGDPLEDADLKLALTELAGVQEWLAANLIEEPPTILRAALLPYRSKGLTARELVLEPAIQPSYADAGDPQPAPADLAPTLEAPFSEEILRQAEELDHDYVRIYEFVRNEIDTEWYAGSLKGARGTLLQGSGNDIDQASLLIALLRASQAPARYVRGAIELPIETLAADLGVPEDRVATALTRAGVAHQTVIRGGRVAALRVEHTWVSVHVPYANYRGAVVDFSGPTWLPLFPALKHYERTPATGILEAMGLSSGQFLADYLSAPQPSEPLVTLRQQVEDYLDQHAQDESYEDQLAGRVLGEERLRFLPSSLPVEVAAATFESAVLTDNNHHRVRLVVRSGESETDPILLDYQALLADLLGQRVTLSYQPATLDDHTTVNLFGGLDAVPLYLISLRPQIMIAGRQAAVGDASDAGIRQRLEIELTGPFGNEQMAKTVISGNYYALGLTGQKDVPIPVIEDDPADSEQLGARILSQMALGYSERWGEAEEELGQLLDVAVFRPLAAVVVSGNAVDIATLFGLPVELAWEGVTLDAALRIAEPISRTDNTAQGPEWMRLAALQGSALEHFLFEEDFLVESISADKGLGLARQTGIAVVIVDSQNIGALLPTLNHPEAVLDEIENQVRLGRVVEVPEDLVSLNAWQGSVWRVEEESTGAGGYFIAGGLAGGQTSEEPESWILDFLKDALEAPYSSEPNTDPLAGAEIVKLGASDGQTGEVGELLPTRLAVQVRDEAGRPVKGAAVQFYVTTGEGVFVDEEGGETAAILAFTDALGIASTRFRLGESTDADPVYVRPDPGDEFVTKATLNRVEAVALTYEGSLYTETPFEFLALPGPAVSLIRTDTHGGSGSPERWADTIHVQAQDSFGNPVSNALVTFEVRPPVTYCDPPPPDLKNAAVFDNRRDEDTGFFPGCSEVQPTLGDCGAPSFTRYTSFDGASAGVILGNSYGTTYSVDVTAPGLPGLSYTYFTYGGGPDFCESETWLSWSTSFAANESGENINAAKVGEELSRPVRVTLLYSIPDYEVRLDADGNYYLFYLPSMTWERTTGQVGFGVSNGGFSTGVLYVDDGTYETWITTGPTPGINEVTLDAVNVEVLIPRVNTSTGEVTMEPEFWTISGSLADVWGLDPKITGFDPEQLTLTDESRLAQDSSALYRIEPTDYRACHVEVFFYEDGEFFDYSVGSSTTGDGVVPIPRGYPFDVTKQYTAKVFVNRGRSVEVTSDFTRLPLRQKIFANVDEFVYVSQDADLLNQRICEFGSAFEFSLTHEATVTLTFTQIEGLNFDGSPNLGREVVLINGEVMPAGDHELVITTADLLPGDYVFELLGVSSIDGHEETAEGVAKSELTTRDSLPVGHAVVKGVDLFDGHLTVSRQDFVLPGRGVPLEFNRVYSSNAPSEGGPLGIRWSHSLDSKIVVTPCGEVIVIGGQGSGMRFVDDGQGGLRPLKGYHGSLVANHEDNSFDFYPKDGSRFHYVKSVGPEWRLDYAADTNGNTTTYLYDTSGRGPKLVAVQDSSGRSIDLTYENKVFRFWSGEVITSVSASGGYSLALEYDDYGNLIRATREQDALVESYTYATSPDDPIAERHLLMATTNDINSATTLYTYETGAIGLQGDVQLESFFVSQLREPEGGITAFTYDMASLGSRAPPELTAQVTDQRDKLTTYTLNQYGSPLRIRDPLGNETSTTWAADDVVMLSRTDANGISTTFSYDEHANLLTETISVTDFDGASNTYSKVHTYWPPTTFDPPVIKNRVRTTTNRNGTTQTFSYDLRGNLTGEMVTVGTIDGPATYTTAHSYDDKGDRRSTTDARGVTTFFGYDVHGNRTLVTDPLGGETETLWSTRSQPVSQTDALGRSTSFDYDTLGRLTRRSNPGDEIEVTVYDDAASQIHSSDAEGRTTTITKDLEGRTVRIDNAAGGTKLFDHDLAGNKVLESLWHDTQTPRHDITFTYDDAGRLVSRIEPLGRITSYGYDAAGNVLSETLTGPGMAPRVAEWDYDALNRQIRMRQILDTGPVEMRVKFDGEDNKILELDALGRQTEWTYDGLNRLIQQTEPLGKITQLLYDGNGNLVEERKLNSTRDQIRTFAYDANNRAIKHTDALEEDTVFEYDAVGNLTRHIDQRLHVTSYEYDDRDRRTKITIDRDGADVITQFVYDNVGNVLEEIQPNGNVISRTFDQLNRVETVIDILGAVAASTFDGRGNVLTRTDANGNLTENTWDALDRLLEQKLPEDRALGFTYDAAGNQLTRTNARNHTTTYEYDRLNRRIKTTDPAPFLYTTEATYDAVGNRLTETDRRGHTTSFEYDDLDRLVKITDPEPLAFVREITYDALGNKLSETDRRQILTTYDYDLENRLTKTSRAGLVIEERDYDPAGNVRFITDANRNIIGYEYDELNRLTAENRPLAAITRLTLDEMGKVVEERDPEGRITEREYDLRSRLVAETNGADERSEFGYDDNGNRTLSRRPEGNEWNFTYDGADRLVGVTDPLGATTSFGYDDNDNRASILDDNNHETAFEYDELDRLTAKIYADGSREEMAYDGNANVVEIRDPLLQVTSFAYDELDRETLREYSNPASPTGDDLLSVATDYDPNANPLRITETYGGATGARITIQSFDDFDRLLSVTDPDSKTLSYSYDANGNRTQLRDPDGRVTQYSYDDLNRLRTVTLSLVGITEYEYLRNGLLKRITYPNGAKAAYTHDDGNRIIRIENTQSAALVSSFDYDYDLNGNRILQVEVNGGGPETTSYAYDAADRLTEVAYPDKTTTYTLDGVGNRLTEQEIDLASTLITDKTYVYDERDRIVQLLDAVDPSRDVVYTWDANGNQASRTRNGVRTDFSYDIRDQLDAVLEDGVSQGTYSYDYKGLRTRKETATGTTRYVYDDRSVLLQTDDAGSTLAKYDYGPDRLLSIGHATEPRQFYLFDGLRSVVNLMRTDGGVQVRYQYDAWGNPRATVGSSFSPFGFTSHERDDETGLYYAKARFYDPEIGRFLTEDPFEGFDNDPPSLHRYLYAKSNPLIYVDPTGEVAFIEAIRDFFREGGTENAAFLAQDIDAHPVIAVLLGLMGAAADTSADVVAIVNFGADALVMKIAPDTETGRKAAADFDQTVTDAKNVINMIVEDPMGVGSNIVVSVVETGSAVLEGDAAAITKATSFTAQLLVGAKGAGQTKSLVKVTVKVGDAAEDSATKTVKFLNELSEQTAKAQQKLTRNANCRSCPDAPSTRVRGQKPETSSKPQGASKSPNQGIDLPELPDGYHYRRVGDQVQVARNPGRAADLDPMHLDDTGKLKLGPRPGASRSLATRTAFLKQLDLSKYPKWMHPYLKKGKVPPGFEVDHVKALFDDGTDVIENMRLRPIDLHRTRHKFYRPGGKVPSINPPKRPN